MCSLGRTNSSSESVAECERVRFSVGEIAMMNPISTLFSAALILVSLHVAEAQTQATTSRIGVLYLGAPNVNVDVFIQRLRELGHIEGKNITIEYRFAQGKEDRLPDLATELVGLKMDAIFTAGTPAIFALKRATKTIPIIFFALAIRLAPVLSRVWPTPVATSRA